MIKFAESFVICRGIYPYDTQGTL